MATKSVAVNAAPEQVHLWYRDIRSDKTYSLSLSQCESGWIVLAQFGRRRNATQQADIKAENVGYEKAKGIFDRVLRARKQRL